MRPLNKHSKLFQAEKEDQKAKKYILLLQKRLSKLNQRYETSLHPGNEEIELRLRLVRLENIINENIEEFTRKTEEIEHSRLKICRC